MYLFKPCIHENKALKSINYTFGPCCPHVCLDILYFRNFPILHYHLFIGMTTTYVLLGDGLSPMQFAIYYGFVSDFIG
jgi:hypothetical protein